MTAIFNQSSFGSDGQIDNKRIENSIARNILNDKKMKFPTDTDYISMPNTAEELKEQSIDEKKLFTETELKRMGEMLKR